MDNITTHIVSIMLENLSKYSELKDAYAIAIYTAEGKVYTYKAELNIENERIYSDIRSSLKDSIQYIVCVIGEKMTIDIPPYHLRQKLCEINEKNYEAQIVMQGENGFNLRKMKSTLL